MRDSYHIVKASEARIAYTLEDAAAQAIVWDADHVFYLCPEDGICRDASEDAAQLWWINLQDIPSVLPFFACAHIDTEEVRTRQARTDKAFLLEAAE